MAEAADTLAQLGRLVRFPEDFHIPIISLQMSNKHETFNQCWINAGTASKTMRQP